MIQITEKQRKEVSGKFTKYEVARILGARALQVSMNAPILIKLSKEEMEALNYDPLKIAELEFFEGILPITVKRPMPVRTGELGIKRASIKEVEEIVKKEIPKKETKAAEGKKESKKPQVPAEKEVQKIEQPKLEDAILEEVEQTEIMELATPEDEVEEEPPVGEEKE